jgi:hypothetical protein
LFFDNFSLLLDKFVSCSATVFAAAIFVAARLIAAGLSFFGLTMALLLLLCKAW